MAKIKRLKVVEGSKKVQTPEVLTYKAALKTLAEMFKEDGAWNEEARFLDIVDYLGMIGVPGAPKTYMESIIADTKKLRGGRNDYKGSK